MSIEMFGVTQIFDISSHLNSQLKFNAVSYISKSEISTTSNSLYPLKPWDQRNLQL